MSAPVTPFLSQAALTTNLALDVPYIFVIVLCCLIFVLILILVIREIFIFRGLTQNCCACDENCCACGECCLACAETCNCCNTTSVESCLDACCPKRGKVDFADIITCEACCTGQCCECGNTACICAPTDVSNVNCLCCAFQQQRPRQNMDD